MSSMWWDLSLQVLMFIIPIGTYLYMNSIPQKLLDRYNTYRHRNTHQSRRHFVKAASLLSQARSHPAKSLSYAAEAAAEADAAVKLNPSDAANHVVLALALDLQGYKTSALEAMSAALSPLASWSLEGEEKAEAMVKRAELRVEVSRNGGKVVDDEVWSVVERELREVVEVKESAKAWCLIGESCQGLGKLDLATEAFQQALRVDPASLFANQALKRLADFDNQALKRLADAQLKH